MKHRNRNVKLVTWPKDGKRKKLGFNAWPEGYFELFGSIRDKDFGRPARLRQTTDVRRIKLYRGLGKILEIASQSLAMTK
jgi:hypothetical protein